MARLGKRGEKQLYQGKVAAIEVKVIDSFQQRTEAPELGLP